MAVQYLLDFPYSVNTIFKLISVVSRTGPIVRAGVPTPFLSALFEWKYI